MIEFSDVTVRYRVQGGADTMALDQLSLRVAAGTWLAVTGGNGCGKTTLLAAVAGVVLPTDGRVRVGSGNRAPRVAFLLQEPDNQFVATTVRHEIELSAPPGDSAAAADVVQRFQLQEFLDRNPHRLSGGEKQRLALATVWLQQPDIVLLDEPLAFLDASSSRRSIDVVRQMHARGATIVWATPGGDDLALADDAVWLDHGRFRGRGAADVIVQSARDAGVALDPPAVPALAARLGADARTIDELVDAMIATAIVGPRNEFRDATPATPATTTVSIRDATFRFGERSVLDGVGLEVAAGECVGIAGANASGKTTLLLLAAGVHKSGAGTVRLPAASPFYLTQSPERMFFAESVLEELTFGPRLSGMSRAEAERRAIIAVESVSLDPDVVLRRSPFDLSPGEMRRVAFAIVAMIEPPLLLLDEPTSCLDGAGVTLFREFVEAQCRRGAAVVVASHDVALLCETCDRVLLLADGRVAVEMSAEDGVAAAAVWPGVDPPVVVRLQQQLFERGAMGEPLETTVDRFVARVESR